MIGTNRNNVIQLINIYMIAVIGLLILAGQAQALPSEQWNKSFGGAGRDVFNSVLQTTDGGFILAGSTSSGLGSVSNLSLTKVDANGNMQWIKIFSGQIHNEAQSIRKTADGGYIIAGGTNLDAWMIKTDKDGNEQWNKTFGGKGFDKAYFAWQARDGSYILGGPTTSDGTGQGMAWLIKTDAGGNETWNKTFEGTQGGAAIFALRTSDGGYILAGSISSFNDEKTDMLRSSRPTDALLIRTDADGNELWNRSFGGKESESFSTVVQESNGGFLISGSTNSFSTGFQDCWIVKTDPDGNELWNKTYGGKDFEYAYLNKASDGGYILAGSTGSHGAGELDAWLVKIDSNGNEQWNRTFGGKYSESIYSFDETEDGGYILAGAVYGDPYPNGDALLIKVTGEGKSGSASDGKSQASSSGKSIPGFEVYLTVFSLSSALVLMLPKGNRNLKK